MPQNASAIPSQYSADIAPVRRRIVRVDCRSNAARRVKQLISAYGRRLGDLAADPIVAADIAKLAEHEALAENLRGHALNRLPVDYAVLNHH